MSSSVAHYTRAEETCSVGPCRLRAGLDTSRMLQYFACPVMIGLNQQDTDREYLAFRDYKRHF